jgi:GH25 family lysozyme M1 (1,4-beta-N-acetylmuramidase)
MRAWALEFFREFEARTGLICMFYSNRDMINQIMAGISAADKAEFLRHDLWLATHAAFGNPSPWLKYRLNQYELDFVISWAHGTVDLNDFNGTEADFTAWSNSQVPPAPLALEEKVNILWREAGSHGWNLHP